jgi:dTDP-glucose pyrophosphorylase
MADLTQFILSPDATIGEAVQLIERNQRGIALVADGQRRLLGTITDGDLRRAFLRHHDLGEGVHILLQRDPTSPHPVPLCGRLGMSPAVLLDLLQEHALRQLPVLDDDDRLVDVVFLSDLSIEREVNVRAVVMAGGFGTRLRPFTEDTPKPMLQVGKKPLMEHMIDQIRSAGIHNVHVTTHYLPEKIHDHFGDGGEFGVELNYVPEEEPLGTAGALGLLKERHEPLLVVNGDILTKVNFADMINFHRDSKASITIGVTIYEIEIPYGVVEADGSMVRSIVEKPRYRHFVSAGMYVIEPEVLDLIPQGQRYDMPDLIKCVIARRQNVVSFPIREYWLDVGRPEDFRKAQRDLTGVEISS